jgi:hypothetical protein
LVTRCCHATLQEALAVPDVPSPLDAIKEFMSYLDIEPSITLFLGIGMMLFGLLTFLVRLLAVGEACCSSRCTACA